MDAPEVTTASLKDRSDSGVAAMLSRFRNLVALSALGKKGSQKDDGTAATKEVAAAHALSMEVETAALVTAAEDLLQLTRELKELWLFGPLRGIGEGEGEGRMDEDSVKVGELVETLLRKDAEFADSKLGS